MAGMLVQENHPLSKLTGVGDGGTEKDLTNTVGKKDYRFLPDDASFLLTHVVNLIEDDPTQFTRDLRAPKFTRIALEKSLYIPIEHRSKNFCCHN